jgi:hypothetical protein
MDTDVVRVWARAGRIQRRNARRGRRSFFIGGGDGYGYED